MTLLAHHNLQDIYMSIEYQIIIVTGLDELVKSGKVVKIVGVHHTAVARTSPRPGRGRRRRLLAWSPFLLSLSPLLLLIFLNEVGNIVWVNRSVWGFSCISKCNLKTY